MSVTKIQTQMLFEIHLKLYLVGIVVFKKVKLVKVNFGMKIFVRIESIMNLIFS